MERIDLVAVVGINCLNLLARRKKPLPITTHFDSHSGCSIKRPAKCAVAEGGFPVRQTNQFRCAGIVAKTDWGRSSYTTADVCAPATPVAILTGASLARNTTH